MNSGSCGLPEVSDEIVLVLDAELTLARPVLSSVTRSVVAVAGDGAAENVRCEPDSAVLSARGDRAHAAGEIDADLHRIGVGGVLQRQRRRIGHVHQRDLALGVGAMSV